MLAEDTYHRKYHDRVLGTGVVVIGPADSLLFSAAVAFTQDPSPDPAGKRRGRREPKPREVRSQGYSIEQAVSDKAQLNTIAFSGLAFMTGTLGADTFLPLDDSFGPVAGFSPFSYTSVRTSRMGKTAAQLTTQEKNNYRKFARLREKTEMRELLARRKRAWSIARKAARILKESFGVTRVLLFGSLVTESWFHIRSDVDLAVEGLKPEDFWRADCRLESIADGFEIDLVDLSTAPPGLKRTIDRDGKEI